MQVVTLPESRRVSRFLPLALLSPSDRLKTAKQLGRSIDGDHKNIYVYRKRKAMKTLCDIDQLAGEGPIWQGLG